MSFYIWPALGIAIVAVAASAFFAVASAIRAWRSFRRFTRKTSEALESVVRRTELIERHLTAAGTSATQLERANRELQESLATARVLSNAFGEVRTAIGRVTGLVPSK